MGEHYYTISLGHIKGDEEKSLEPHELRRNSGGLFWPATFLMIFTNIHI